MAVDLILRFFIGGVVVASFAAIGELFRPKTFSGIFGGAPSVALATLALTVVKQPAGYVATEGAAMMLGAVALGVYALLVGWVLDKKRGWSAWAPALGAWCVWAVVAFGLLGLTKVR